jgi:hypothetical protein
MKLFELAAPSATEKIAKVFESHFGSKITFENLSARQAKVMLTRVRSVLSEHRASTARHVSHDNPDYLKLVMLEQALISRISEQTVGGAGVDPTAQPGAAAQQVSASQQASAITKLQSKFADPKVKTALRKHMTGQRLTPQETRLVQGAQMTMTENQLRRAWTILQESEIQQAQVVLAAQDMVDKMQDMLEDVTEMQFKELPALVDSMKNQVGLDQAQQFNTDASAALTGLVQNLQAAKQQMETALGVVTGQAPPADPAAAALGAPAEPAAAMPGDTEVDSTELDVTDVEEPAPVDDQEDAAPAAGALGRAKR